MRRFVKWIALLLAILLSLILIVGVLLSAYFDPNDYKPVLIRLVQEKNQRTLSIPGRIHLSFFPRLGAELGQVSLSEHNASTPFAAVDSASVSLQLLPLLHRQLIVDQISIDGLHAHIRHEKNGSNNIDDLLGTKKSDNEPAQRAQSVQLDIDHVRISHADVLFEDQATQRRIQISDLNFSTGRVASGVPTSLELTAHITSNQPAALLEVKIKSGFKPDFEGQLFDFENTQIQVHGKLNGKVLAASMSSTMHINLAKQSVAGKLSAEAVEIAGLRLASLETLLQADSKKITLNPLAAKLYGGSLHGAMTVNTGKPLRISMTQNLQGIQLAPLLKDVMGKEPIEGRADVALDLHTEGIELTQFKRNVNGAAKLQVRDGALRGINIAKTLRDAKNKLHALSSGDLSQLTGTTNTSVEKTDFSTLQGNVKIINGVAHNEDLAGSSPVLQLHGAGQADLVTEKLDYLIKASVPELQGFTLPVKLGGTFSAVSWKLDTSSLGSQLLKQKKEGLQEKLKDQLKGLFGK
jgi:AsmA protein